MKDKHIGKSFFLSIAFTALQFMVLYWKNFSTFNNKKVFSSFEFFSDINSTIALEFISFIGLLFFSHFLIFFIIFYYTSSLKKIKSVRSSLINTSIVITIITIILSVNSIAFEHSIFNFRSDIEALVLSTLILILSHLLIKKGIQISKPTKYAVTTILITAATFFSVQLLTNDSDIKPTSKNLIILSVDSLRPDIINIENPQLSSAPFISTQLAQSHYFNNAYTPLARTFPSWMTILTGQYPNNHKAQFNLTNPKRLGNIKIFAQELQNRGYVTTYITDEKRFSNISHEMGFTDILGPKAGISDFIIGSLSDIPLLNLLTLIPKSELLLPYTTLNRAAHITYDPLRFANYTNNKISKYTAINKPVAIFLHLCLPHHPFGWKDSTKSTDYNENYFSAVSKADEQVKMIYEFLKNKNIINNESTQLFLSDHGESLPEDRVTFQEVSGKEHTLLSVGHGTDSRQLKQHHVIIGIQNTHLEFKNDSKLVSLMDIAPTIEYLFYPKQFISSNYDGNNLLTSSNNTNSEPWIRLETGYNVDAVLSRNLNEGDIISQAIDSYRITNNNKVVIKDSVYDHLLEQKKYSWWNGEELITQENNSWFEYNWNNRTVREISENNLPNLIMNTH